MQRHKDRIEWAIGIFEGEGNIYRNDKTRQFIMSVHMKDEDVVKRFYKTVNCGKVIKRKPYLHYAPMWEWRLTRTNDILKLAKIIFPFMSKRRKIQISKAIVGKTFIKEKQNLKIVKECGRMRKDEISAWGAKFHVRNGEKPCHLCAENQRKYLQNWRKTFFEVNQ